MGIPRVRELVASIQAELVELLGVVDPVIEPPPPNIPTVRIRPGDDADDAMRSLESTGGLILAQPGVYLMNWELPERAPTAHVITIRTDTENLPAPGTRITPDYRPGLAEFRSATSLDPLFRARNRSSGVIWDGVAFGPQAPDRTMIELGGYRDTMATPDLLPTNFFFYRCLFVGSPTQGQHKALQVHAKGVSIHDCWFKDIFEFGRDSQAIGAYNGGHDVVVDNNHIEGGAENIMLGGAESASSEMLPRNWLITRNHIMKPLSWKTLARVPSIKNLLELKTGIGVVIEGNVFEGCWARDWASGVAVIFKVANSNNKESWAKTADVSFLRNVIRNVGSVHGVVGARDSGFVSERMENLLIRGNLAYNIRSSAEYTGTGQLMPIGSVPVSMAVDHNTFLGHRHSFLGPIESVDRGALTFTNNIVEHGDYGIFGESSFGTAALDKYWPGAYTVSGNAVRKGPDGAVTRPLPAGNPVIPRATFDAAMANMAPVPGGAVASVVTTDGAMVGADLAAIRAALSPEDTL